MEKVAKVISRIFDPIVEIPLLFALAVWYAHVNGHSWLFLSVLIFVDAFLPFLFFLFLLRIGKVRDWDIRRRRERIPIYGFALLTQIAGVGMAVLSGRMAVAQILLLFWLLGVLFFVITWFWKISVHAGVNATLVTFLSLAFDQSFAWGYLLLVPVGWARMSLKHHNLWQFLVGAVVATLVTWGGFWLFQLRALP